MRGLFPFILEEVHCVLRLSENLYNYITIPIISFISRECLYNEYIFSRMVTGRNLSSKDVVYIYMMELIVRLGAKVCEDIRSLSTVRY